MTIDLFKGYLPGIHMLDIPTILFSKAIKEPSFEEMLLCPAQVELGKF